MNIETYDSYLKIVASNTTRATTPACSRMATHDLDCANFCAHPTDRRAQPATYSWVL